MDVFWLVITIGSSLIFAGVAYHFAVLAYRMSERLDSRIDKALKTMIEMTDHSEECFDEIHERLNQAGLKQAESRMKEVRKLRLAGKL